MKFTTTVLKTTSEHRVDLLPPHLKVSSSNLKKDESIMDELWDFIETIPMAEENQAILDYFEALNPDQITVTGSSHLRADYFLNYYLTQLTIDWYPENPIVNITVQILGSRLECACRPGACGCLFMDSDGVVWPSDISHLWEGFHLIRNLQENVD